MTTASFDLHGLMSGSLLWFAAKVDGASESTFGQDQPRSERMRECLA